MIESWLQVSCDGCGVTFLSPVPDLKRAEFRADYHRYGWKTLNQDRDYCKACVKLGHHKVGHSIYRD